MKMFYCHLFFVSAVLFSSSLSIPSKQQIPLQENNRSPFTAEFDEAVTHLLNQWHVPGLSIAVIDGDETFSKV